MRLTKMGHSCVRLDRRGSTLVIDPGAFTEAEAIDGAGAVLITHEHPDHFDADRILAAAAANPALEIWTTETVAAALPALGSRVHAVAAGDTFSAAGFEVSVHGHLHAVIHPDIPPVQNACFLVGGRVFHPGDSLTPPPVTGVTLLLPIHAPWLKLAEAIDYVRHSRPAEVYPIHEGMLNERGLGVVDRVLSIPGILAGGTGAGPAAHPAFRRLNPGDAVDLEAS